MGSKCENRGSSRSASHRMGVIAALAALGVMAVYLVVQIAISRDAVGVIRMRIPCGPGSSKNTRKLRTFRIEFAIVSNARISERNTLDRKRMA